MTHPALIGEENVSELVNLLAYWTADSLAPVWKMVSERHFRVRFSDLASEMNLTGRQIKSKPDIWFDLVSEGKSTTAPVGLSVYEVVGYDKWSKNRPIFSITSEDKRVGEGLRSLYTYLFKHEVSRKKSIVGSAVEILRDAHDRK